MGSPVKGRKSSPHEGIEIRSTLTFRISPSAGLLSLVSSYGKALNFVMNWLKKNKPKTKIVKQVHNAVYRQLREKFNLPSKVAQDCYRNAIAVYKSWLRNPRRGSFPKVKRFSVWLTPKLTYRLDLENMKVNITSVGELSIVGYPRNYALYKDWEIKEARLKVVDGKAFLKVTFLKEVQPTTASSGVAVDVNVENITVGNDKHHVIIPSRIDDAKHFKLLAEGLQKKYGNKTFTVKRIRERYLSFHRKATRILEDFAKKAGKWVVDVTKMYGASVIFLEDLNNMIKNVNKLAKPFRDKLYLMQYRRIQHWIEWQAIKHGLKVVKVPAFYTSTKCPKCGSKMKEYSHRQFRCVSCGYENDRDVIAVMNLYGRGSLILSTAGQMRGSKESQCPEPPPFRAGRKSAR
ncbi:MAG: RNA-guided endonuclease TnpB family protein [Candidatus Aramenus sulfurataquae]|jgi:IS605 OrfB family transposase|uniref:RNA-guided endonuclease TnpB family protein n=1 Tax=Candidatus Aramenus sulfurataquae TaxID=1326980 RepID=A0ACC6TS30_9CREN